MTPREAPPINDRLPGDWAELEEPRPPREGAVHAWLDSWAWVELTRARLGPDNELRGCLEKLEAAVSDGRLQLLLGSGNYMEVWNRSDRQSRTDVARTMARLTGYATIRAVHEIVDVEAEAVVRAWRVSGDTRPSALREATVFGLGARHAFASETGRFRFVESLATRSEPEGPETSSPPELAAAFRRAGPPLFEWINLVGLDDGYDIPGIDYRPTHRDGDEWADSLNAFVRHVRERTSERDVLYRGIVGRHLSVLFEQSRPLQEASDDFRRWLTTPADWVALLESMPVSRAYAKLIHSTLRNPEYSLKQHDRVDVQELATALPYCDVVVPDRHWAHQARAAGLGETFGTKVVSGPRGLVTWADSL